MMHNADQGHLGYSRDKTQPKAYRYLDPCGSLSNRSPVSPIVDGEFELKGTLSSTAPN